MLGGIVYSGTQKRGNQLKITFGHCFGIDEFIIDFKNGKINFIFKSILYT